MTLRNSSGNALASEVALYYSNSEHLDDTGNEAKAESEAATTEFKPKIYWMNVFSITLFHLVSLYTIIFKLNQFKLATLIYGTILGLLSGLGVTGGAHRLWAHKSYKVKWPLKLILLFFYSVAGQNSVYDWVRYHRIHHKYSETDADPHNIKRGFFFAHVGWLMQRRHPEVIRRGAQVDMSDITEDPILAFHTKYFLPIKFMCCFIIPPLIPIYFWNEDFTLAILWICFFRYVTCLNITWLINSAAHMYGNKPYDRRICASENITISFFSLGESWHNYHHSFPWDYKTAELGPYKFNLTATMIDTFAKIGWAYDLKTASPALVQSTLQKHGDGTYNANHSHQIYQD